MNIFKNLKTDWGHNLCVINAHRYFGAYRHLTILEYE